MSLIRSPNVSSLLRRWAALACVVLIAGAQAGCGGFIPGSGPLKSDIVEGAGDEQRGYALIEVTAATVSHYAPRGLGNDGGGGAGATTQADVRLAPGDTVKVLIGESAPNGVLAPLASGGTTFNNVMVDGRGFISLPYAGSVQVRGMSPAQVERTLRQRLSGQLIDPQIYVELVANRNHSVLVAGEVKQPARISLLEGPMTLLDAIARAGGLNGPAMQHDAVVRGGGGVRRVAMARVYNGGNFALRAGDVVTVVAANRKFNAMGAVRTPGLQQMTSFDQNLLDALNQVGGLNDVQANPTGVFLFRGHATRAYVDAQGRWRGGWAIFQFDMRQPETIFLAQGFGIQPNDTIFVTNAPATEWMKLIQPLAMTLVTVRSGVSVSN